MMKKNAELLQEEKLQSEQKELSDAMQSLDESKKNESDV